MRTAEQLRAELAELTQQRDGVTAGHSNDPAMARLAPGPLRRHHARMDRDLTRYVDLTNRIQAIEFKIGLADAREREAARPRLTREDIAGATHVLTEYGWAAVTRVNKTTVTTSSGDRYPFGKIHDTRH